MSDTGFAASRKFIAGPPNVLAVCCSDGRFASHNMEFARAGLGIGRCDGVVIRIPF